MKNRRDQRWLLAFSLIELMAVTAIVTSIPAAQYAKAQQKAHQIECGSNLQQIGVSITAYQTGENKFPDAVFYPDKPFEDPKSICKILENSGAGIPKEMWICPAAPDSLKQRGMTFVYNDSFAGRQSLPNPSKAWLLIEVNCVSKKVPPPHPQGYNILFADGHVMATNRLPASITSKQQASLEQLRRDVEGHRLASLFLKDTPSSDAR
ncbi:MAG: hypothetical protein A3K19_29090 [Lentisphaerae bacterium RIFOXYB12_FULL_65_16]|nr:MAG: hypothetical protein A3K18_04480 [Lentisphaerae bacterium RIFOXYA12_64_32]OGV88354.1 MAG: hypothetical protein A3K19_29090 [Lentisphaerae bacterium RIFOXYB12_FULL_65_16]